MIADPRDRRCVKNSKTRQRVLSVAGLNDALQAIGELSSRKGLCDCRFMRKKVARLCVGLSPM